MSSKLSQIVEAALLTAGRPLNLKDLQKLFQKDAAPAKKELQQVIVELQELYKERGVELVEVANGWRFQVPVSLSLWISRLFVEKPPRYSSAFLETLALIVYRQPITRAEIEQIRGVAVSSKTVKTMLDRNWINTLGHKEVPGRPVLYGTTKTFLDDFNLKSLEDLPPLAQVHIS